MEFIFVNVSEEFFVYLVQKIDISVDEYIKRSVFIIIVNVVYDYVKSFSQFFGFLRS